MVRTSGSGGADGYQAWGHRGLSSVALADGTNKAALDHHASRREQDWCGEFPSWDLVLLACTREASTFGAKTNQNYSMLADLNAALGALNWGSRSPVTMKI